MPEEKLREVRVQRAVDEAQSKIADTFDPCARAATLRTRASIARTALFVSRKCSSHSTKSSVAGSLIHIFLVCLSHVLLLQVGLEGLAWRAAASLRADRGTQPLAIRCGRHVLGVSPGRKEFWGFAHHILGLLA